MGRAWRQIADPALSDSEWKDLSAKDFKEKMREGQLLNFPLDLRKGMSLSEKGTHFIVDYKRFDDGSAYIIRTKDEMEEIKAQQKAEEKKTGKRRSISNNSGKNVDRLSYTAGRRMAAIPLTEQPQELLELPSVSSVPAMATLGVASTALICIGCALKRKFRQFKDTLARDSMGFLPISRRTSLTKAELSV